MMSSTNCSADTLSLIFSDYIMDCSNEYLRTGSNAFKRVSYKRWAVDELETEIFNKMYPREECPLAEVEDIVRSFVSRMTKYSYKNKKTRLIFATAQDVGSDILDILRSMEG